MKRSLTPIFFLLLVTTIFTSALLPLHHTLAQAPATPASTAPASASGTSNSTILGKTTGIFFNVVGTVLSPIAVTLLGLCSLLAMMSGVLLNTVIQHTVLMMTANFTHLTAIDTTWATVRDVANMGFIFVLLYAGIKTIIGDGSDNQKLIRDMVIAAILVNFSLFFTKLVIDASNVLAISFYGSIAPGALTGAPLDTGISNTFMNIMKLQTLFQIRSALNPANFTTVGILGSIVLLAAAFSFFVVAVMFIIRYVVLIFVLILSPIAFVASILPEMKKYRTQWWNALSGQAFFAPIYFFLTWVTLSVLRGVVDASFAGKTGWAEAFQGTLVDGKVNYSAGTINLIIQFSIVLAFMFASLIAAKASAKKAGSMVTDITKWATGASGNFAYGLTSWAGRNTLARIGANAASNAQLQEDAYGPKAKTGLGGARARLNLGLANKMRGGTYDPRNAVAPGRAIGEAIEGTAGRTKIGQRFGLNDVSILQNAAVGAAVAAQTGVGKGGTTTFISSKKESEERIRERDKSRAEDLRKVQVKQNINKGAEAAKTDLANRTSDQDKAVEEMVNTLKKMSEADIKTQKANVLAIQEVAEALNQKQVDAIENSGSYTGAEVQAIKDSRNRGLAAAFTSGGAVHIPARAGTPTTLATPALTGWQEAMRRMREAEAPTLARMAASYDPADPTTHNKPSLNHPDILEFYTPSILGKLIRQNEFTQEKADKVKAAILAAGPGAAGSNLHKSWEWLQPGHPGDNIFG